MAVDPFAGSFVAWRDGRRSDTFVRWDIYVQLMPRLVAGRAPEARLLGGIGAWTPNGVAACQSGTAGVPFAVPDDSGGVLVLWSNESPRGIFAQRLLGNGSIAPGWPADGRLVTSDVYDQQLGACGDGAGGAYLIRTRYDFLADQVAATVSRVTRLGTFAAGWSENGVIVAGDEIVEAVSLAPDPSGGAVFTVRTYLNTPSADFRRVQAGRVSATAQVTLSRSLPAWRSGNGLPGVVAHRAIADGGGGMFAAWNDAMAPGFYGQHWSGAGSVTWPDSLEAPFLDGLGTDGAGGVFLVGRAKGAPNRLAIQRRDSGGGIHAGWSPSGTTLAQPVSLGAVAGSAGPTGALVAWAEDRGGGAGLDVRATVVQANGSLGVGFVPGGEPISDVAGNQANPVWAAGSQVIVWEDERNLGATGTDLYVEYFQGPIGGVGVTPSPSKHGLAIRSVSPNPASGALRLALTLESGAPARLELVDLRGRVARRQELAAAAGPTSAVVVTDGLPAGLYFVRVLQGGRAAHGRVVVLD